MNNKIHLLIFVMLIHSVNASLLETEKFIFDIPNNVRTRINEKSNIYTFKWNGLEGAHLTLTTSVSDQETLNNVIKNYEKQFKLQYAKGTPVIMEDFTKTDLNFSNYVGQQLMFRLSNAKTKMFFYTYCFVLFKENRIWVATLNTSDVKDVEITKNILVKLKSIKRK